jgi:hypothetical protein
MRQPGLPNLPGTLGSRDNKCESQVVLLQMNGPGHLRGWTKMYRDRPTPRDRPTHRQAVALGLSLERLRKHGSAELQERGALRPPPRVTMLGRVGFQILEKRAI